MAPPQQRRKKAGGSKSGGDSGAGGVFGQFSMADVDMSPSGILKMMTQSPADLVAVILAVIIVGSVMGPFTDFCGKFSVIQHNVTEISDDPAKDTTRYGPGFYDLFFLTFLVGLIYVIHDILRDLLLASVSKKMQLPKKLQARVQVSMSSIFFLFVNSMMAISSLVEVWSPATIKWFYDDYPHPGMAFFFKVAILFNVAYFIHMVVMVFAVQSQQPGQKPRMEVDHLIDAVAQLTQMSILYVFGFHRLALFIVSFCSLARIVDLVHSLVEHAADYSSTKKNKDTYVQIVGTLDILRRISIVGANGFAAIVAVFMFVMTLANTQAPVEDEEAVPELGNFNVFPIRIVALASVLLAQGSAIFLPQVFPKAKPTKDE